MAEYAAGANSITANRNASRAAAAMSQADAEANFETKVLNDLKQQEQVGPMLDGIAAGAIGVDELVLLLIWTKPLVPP